MNNKVFLKIVIIVFSMALVLALPGWGFCLADETEAAQGMFNDIGDQPAEIQAGIEYSCQQGYMQGYPDGSFHPIESTTRIDCAQALVGIFGHAGEEPDPSIAFTDLPPEGPGYKWANLAVKHGLMDTLPGGSFGPQQPMLFEEVAQGITAGLDMEDTAQKINNLTGSFPSYGGAMAIFMDLHLKYRHSRVWPGGGYPRGEMAYSLYELDNVDDWRISYIEESFNDDRCSLPSCTDEQFQAVHFGFERLGCPYVYAGERESEGGFDCSGFVYNTLYLRMGYPMMRVADDQARDNRYLYVPPGALQPGDAIFFYGQEYGDPNDYINHAGMYVGNGIFIHSTGSNAGVSFDCLDTSGYWGTHLAWGRRVLGGPYYDRFDTFLLLSNPSQENLPVEVRFLRPNDGPHTESYVLPPRSRYTVPVDLLFPYDEVSMEVSAPGQGVVAERAMYFDYQDWGDGGHASTGDSQASLQGYFAEGYTGEGFHTWLLLANPADEAAEVEVNYLLEGGAPIIKRYILPPSTRFTILVNNVEGLDAGNVGISYRSVNNVKLMAERAVYFNYMGAIRGGHCSQAVSQPSTDLYLAEGYTGGEFDTWILLANPGQEDAEVKVTYLLPDSSTIEQQRTVPAMSRSTINAEDKLGEKDFGVKIESMNGVGIVAERAMYFDYDGGKRGGHCSPAVSQPSTSLCLAEGYTGGEFDTWILLANPSSETATASLSFFPEGGAEKSMQVILNPESRMTVKANEVQGLENCSFSLLVESDNPLLVERSMYFFYMDRAGGTNCPALNGTSEYRYFAEGYTGG